MLNSHRFFREFRYEGYKCWGWLRWLFLIPRGYLPLHILNPSGVLARWLPIRVRQRRNQDEDNKHVHGILWAGKMKHLSDAKVGFCPSTRLKLNKIGLTN
jgi:hypothetical protein